MDNFCLLPCYTDFCLLPGKGRILFKSLLAAKRKNGEAYNFNIFTILLIQCSCRRNNIYL